MSRSQRMVLGVLGGFVLLGIGGCKSGMPPKRTLAAREPSLAMPVDPEPGFVAEKSTPSGSVAFVERHPLLSKPKELYDKSGSNKIVKVAGATLVGVPLGIFGELKQIVIGTPASKTY